MEKRTLAIFLMLVISPIILIANTLIARSPIIGVVASSVFFALASWAIGKLLFSLESGFFRVTFGLITILLFLALIGNVLIVLAVFTEIVSSVGITVLGVILGLAFVRFEKSNAPKFSGQSVRFHRERADWEANLLGIIALILTAAALWSLWIGRTGEGGASVWLTIPFFIPLFLIVSFSVIVVLVLTRLNDGLKLGLVCVFSFLVHSLFLLVWYPGRYGDPWKHLGEARYIAETGMPYGYSWMVQQRLIVQLVLRVQEALTVFFGRMLSVDLYWVHVVLVPLLWSTLVPLIAYRIAEMLAVKKSKVFPILTAITTVLFSSLILWGTVSVPNSLGFVFFFASVAFLLSWMNHGGRRMWLLSFLASAVSFLAHPQAGLFAFAMFFWCTVIQKRGKIWGFLVYAPLFMIYPFVLFYWSASFSLGGLLILDNFLSFQSEISTILLVFGVVGLIMGVRNRFVETKGALILFIFYATILSEYYLTNFGMVGLPYGAGRILTMADLLLVPFVALGFFMIARAFGKARNLKSKLGSSINAAPGRFKVGLSRHFVVLLLICLFFTLQATVALYQAYPSSELVKVQPSVYELEAINFIDSDSDSRYVVLCDPIFANLARGTLGAQYGFAGSGRGTFGIGDTAYPIAQMYNSMKEQPSTGILEEAMNFANAATSYFVGSTRYTGYESVIQRAFDTLGEPYKVFGNGKVYLWRYPIPIIEEPGLNVKVTFEDGNFTYVQTKFVYMIRSEVNSTLTLSGHTGYYINEYPMNWTFLDLTVNNMPAKFDESSDVNTFISISGLNLSDTVAVTWLSNSNYPLVWWKDDSLKNGWGTHPLYRGTITPNITSDGNILRLSHSFTPNSYEYYYYVTSVDVSTDDNTYVMVRWKCDGPIAVATVYFESGAVQYVVNLGSQSAGWTTTIAQMPSGEKITMVMVGISDGRAKSLSGQLTFQIDYVMIAGNVSP